MSLTMKWRKLTIILEKQWPSGVKGGEINEVANDGGDHGGLMIETNTKPQSEDFLAKF